MLQKLKKLMHNSELPATAYHFAEFMNTKQANNFVTLAAALLSSENTQGHICIDLRNHASKPAFTHGTDCEITAPALQEWLQQLQQHPWVSSQFPSPIILEDTRLYLGKYWRFETQLANTIKTRLNTTTGIKQGLLASGLNRLFPKTDGAIDWQAVAAAIAVINSFVVISGGPGTGKTSTVIRILALLLEQNPDMKIELVAPTGKAAARLAESIRKSKQDPRLSTITEQEKSLIPESAKTIHRLLRYTPSGFQHDANNLLPIDTLVIDEASMIDLPLMTRLMTAIPATTHVILLGDKDQLSSVEAGNVLGDISGQGQEITYSNEFIQQLEQLAVVKHQELAKPDYPPAFINNSIALLHKSYRFDDHSGIGVAAKLVNRSQGKQALQQVLLEKNYSDASWLDINTKQLDQDCINWAVENYRHYLEQDTVSHAIRAFEQVRILTALRKGIFGVNEINDAIISALARKNIIKQGESFQGKPIMITRNDYELDLFNGDIGLIWKDEDTQILKAHFPSSDGNIRRIATQQLPQHETAFVMTIHKSQGSEFDKLLLILPTEMNPVLTKELIYTGMTRAKKQVLIAGSRDTFIRACNKVIKKSSGLSKKLGWK